MISVEAGNKVKSLGCDRYCIPTFAKNGRI